MNNHKELSGKLWIYGAIVLIGLALVLMLFAEHRQNRQLLNDNRQLAKVAVLKTLRSVLMAQVYALPQSSAAINAAWRETTRNYYVFANEQQIYPKPYRSVELLLRVKALLRRITTKEAKEASLINGFTVDWRSRRVTADNGEIHLTKTAFDILRFLFIQLNNTCTRDQILDEVWGEEVYVDNRTVDNFVANLKKQLNLASGPDYRIKTVRGVGYCMVNQ